MNKDIDYVYGYLKSLTSLLKKTEKEVKDLTKTKEDIASLKAIVSEMKSTIAEVKKIDVTKDLANLSVELINKMAKYHIKDGYWYVGDKKLDRATGYSVKGDTGAPGRDGKDGKNGKDGLKGKDGKNGLNGRDGKDGKDGKNGKDGRDGLTPEVPNVTIGKVKTINPGEDAVVETRETKDGIVLDFYIPRGVSGRGNNAKINGYNTVDIKAGTNVTIEQDGTELTINSTGGGTGTSNHAELTNLDYTSAGHTGFEPAKGDDDNYVTDAEKTVIGNTSGTNSGDNAVNTLYSGLEASKQDTLVSGTNIKTINSTSLLGSGNIDTPNTEYTAGTGISISEANEISSSIVNTDEKVKYDAEDTTAGYVADKVIAGTGISVSEGTGASENKLVITNDNPTPYSLPTATTSTLGGVKIDGSTITISSGVISAATGGSGDVTGPTGATDNNIAVFDGVTGKIIKDGGSTIAAITDAIPDDVSDLTDTTGIIPTAISDLTNDTLVIGTDVQAHDSQLDSIAGLTPGIEGKMITSNGLGDYQISTVADVRSYLNVEDGAEVNNISDTDATDLTDGGGTTLHKHSYNNLDDLPTIPTGFDCSDITIDGIGTPTYTNLCDYISQHNSSGYSTGGEITDATGGEINVAAGTGYIRTTNSGTATLYSFNWSASNGIELDNNVTSYVYVDYNGGSPVVGVETTKAANGRTKFYLGKVFREDTDLHILNAGQNTTEPLKRTQQRLNGVFGEIQRASGMMLSAVGTRQIAVSAGVYFAGLTRLTTDAFDSTATDFEYYYLSNGTWTSVDADTISNTQYNDVSTPGSEALANVSNNNFGVHWVYMDIDGHCSVVYGQGDYAKLSDAEAAEPPQVSYGHIADMSILVGRVIIERGATAFSVVQSAFGQTYSSAVVTNHGDLAGLLDDDHPQYVKDSEYTTDGGILVATGAGTFAEETGATLRTSIGCDPAGTDNSTDVTLNASATTGGMSISSQEISNQAATNAQNGYMTSTLVGNIETNNAKETNATHTGDVTGATSLAIDKTAITGKTGVTAVGTDYVLISDTSDTGNLKKALLSDVISTVTQYTDEMAQDAVGGMVDSSLTYTDGTPELKVTNPVTPAANGFTITAGTTAKTLTVPLDASVSGTNTGDQTAGSFNHNDLANLNAGTDYEHITQTQKDALHPAVTIGTANGLSLSTQALSLGTASTSTTGALTNTDWNTFNGKSELGVEAFSAATVLSGSTKVSLLQSGVGYYNPITKDSSVYLSDNTTDIETWRNSVTQTEMGYVAGVTSDIQTQLNSRDVSSCAFRVNMGSNQSLANATLINYDTEVYDLGSDYNTTNKSFTAPANGLYTFSAQMGVLSPTDQGRYGFLLKNVATTVRAALWPTSGTNTSYPAFTDTIYLEANDVVTLVSFMSDTKSIDATNTLTFWEGHLVQTMTIA